MSDLDRKIYSVNDVCLIENQANNQALKDFVSNFEKEFAPNLDESLTSMIEFNKWFDKVNKIAEQLKKE